MLNHACVEFEDCRVSNEEWGALKPSMAGNAMPNIEFKDGTRIGSTHAIVRMLAAKHGYYPEDPMMAYQNDFL